MTAPDPYRTLYLVTGTKSSSLVIAGVAALVLVIGLKFGLSIFVPSLPNAPKIEGRKSQLVDARQLWGSVVPTRYSYTVFDKGSWYENNGVPYVVRVWESGSSVVYLQDDRSRMSVPERPMFVESLFDLVESAIAADDLIDVTYHQDYGIPVRIRAGHYGQDGGYGYDVVDFRPE